MYQKLIITRANTSDNLPSCISMPSRYILPQRTDTLQPLPQIIALTVPTCTNFANIHRNAKVNYGMLFSNWLQDEQFLVNISINLNFSILSKWETRFSCDGGGNFQKMLYRFILSMERISTISPTRHGSYLNFSSVGR